MKIIQNKMIRALISILSCILYIIFWYIICVAISVGISEGALSVLKDAFGQWILWVGCILAISAFTSILYMRFFVKKEWLVHIIAYSSTIILIIMLILCLNIGESKYKEFSPGKWREFPAQRITMYFDFEEKYNIEGYTSNEIETLLGKPDKVEKDGTYVYEDTYGNGVYVKFEDGRVLYSYYVE